MWTKEFVKGTICGGAFATLLAGFLSWMTSQSLNNLDDIRLGTIAYKLLEDSARRTVLVQSLRNAIESDVETEKNNWEVAREGMQNALAKSGDRLEEHRKMINDVAGLDVSENGDVTINGALLVKGSLNASNAAFTEFGLAGGNGVWFAKGTDETVHMTFGDGGAYTGGNRKPQRWKRVAASWTTKDGKIHKTKAFVTNDHFHNDKDGRPTSDAKAKRK